MNGIEPELSELLRALALGSEPGSDEADLVRRIGRRSKTRRRRRVAGGITGAAIVAVVAALVVPGGTRQAGRPAVLEPATPAAATEASVTPSPIASASTATATRPMVMVTLGASARLPVTLTRSLLVIDTQGLALLSGGTRTELTGTRGASNPGISHDGQWVSWLTVDGDSSTLHVVRSTGGTPALTTGVITAAWSPTADVIAVAEQNSVVVFAPDEPNRVSVMQKFPYQVVWSPDGSQLASNGRPTVVLTVHVGSTGVTLTKRLALPVNDDLSDLAGFYGSGLLFWPGAGGSASIASDGWQLTFLDLDTGVTTALTKTLTYPDWVQRLPAYYADSSLQQGVLIVTGEDRIAEDNKHPAVWLLPVEGGGKLQHVAVTPGSLPKVPSLVSIAVDHLGAIASVTTKQDANYGTSYPLGTLDVQSLYGVSSPVEGAGHSVVAVGSSADGFLVVQAKSLQLLISGGQLVSLGELGAGPDRNAGYYGHLAVSDLVAVATG